MHAGDTLITFALRPNYAGTTLVPSVLRHTYARTTLFFRHARTTIFLTCSKFDHALHAHGDCIALDRVRYTTIEDRTAILLRSLRFQHALRAWWERSEIVLWCDCSFKLIIKNSKTFVVLIAGVTISGTPCPRHITVPFGAEAPSGHVTQAWAFPPPSWGLLFQWHRQQTTTPETNEASSARIQRHS